MYDLTIAQIVMASLCLSGVTLVAVMLPLAVWLQLRRNHKQIEQLPDSGD